MEGRDPSGLCPNGGSLIAVAPVNGSLPGLGISCNKPGGSSNTSANFLSSDRGYTGLSFGDALSAGVGFIPGVGDAYALVSAGIGYDVLAGQSLSATERGLYAAAAFLPVSGSSIRVAKNAAPHIFRNAVGHVNPTTLASQGRYTQLFGRVASNPSNARLDLLNPAARSAGVQMSAQNFQRGQVWVQTGGGQITNAGVNPPGSFR